MLVGRAREMAALEHTLATVARGTGAVRLLVGEAGIGKSHLLAALAGRARKLGFEVLSGRCFPEGAPYLPFREALGALDAGDASLGAVVDRTRLFERVLADLAARADVRPVFIALDDLHWADGDSLHLFLHVVRFGLRAAVLLVGTVRAPDLDGTRNAALDAVLAELAREATCERVALRPLAEPEVRSLAAEIAGAAVPQAVARAIYDETAGNALYVRELVRHLVEEGKLARRGDRMATDFATSALGLPESIRHVVRQRVARLSERAVAVARVVAASFAPIALAPLARACDLAEDPTLDALDEALAAGIVRVAGARYDLSHAIVRRAIYEELNPDRRARLHRRIAESLPPEQHAELAAQYHASRAFPGAEQGFPHAVAAADEARRSAAPDREVAFAAMALDLSTDATRAAASAALARAYARAIDHARAVRATEQCLGLLTADEQIALLTDVARELSLAGAPRASFEPLVARGLALVGPRRDLAWARLALLASKPVSLLEGPVYLSRFGGFDPEAVGILRTAGDELDFASSVDMHDARTPDERRALVAIALEWRAPAAQIRVLEACARDLFFRGELRPALEEADRLLALALAVRSPQGELGACVLHGCCAATLGERERALEALVRSRELARRIGSMHRMSAIGPYALAMIYGLFFGTDWSTVLAPLLDFLGSPRAASTPFGFVPLSLSLVAASMAGERETTERLLGFHIDAMRAIPTAWPEWGAGRDCAATAMWTLGGSAFVDDYLALAERDPETAGCACWSTVDQTRARLLALRGERDAALDALKRARERFARGSLRACLAIADYDEARIRADASRLDAAERVFRELGMAPHLEAAAALRATMGHPEGLTDREVEVLSLLARGESNKAIAAKLFISVPTVERHVANVYARIGARGRAAATAWALKNKLI